jgi:hypothetical protein
MARNSSPETQADDPPLEPAPAPPETVAQAPEAQVTEQTESTLGDGDATGAAMVAPQVSTAPEAQAPDVVTKPSDAVKGHVVRVVGPAKGRYRTTTHDGTPRKFGPEPVDIPTSDLTVEDMEKLFADPELICAVVGES